MTRGKRAVAYWLGAVGLLTVLVGLVRQTILTNGGLDWLPGVLYVAGAALVVLAVVVSWSWRDRQAPST